MFYLDALPFYRCQTCKGRASHQLMASGKIQYGYFCKRCGDKEIARRNRETAKAAQEQS